MYFLYTCIFRKLVYGIYRVTGLALSACGPNICSSTHVHVHRRTAFIDQFILHSTRDCWIFTHCTQFLQCCMSPGKDILHLSRCAHLQKLSSHILTVVYISRFSLHNAVQRMCTSTCTCRPPGAVCIKPCCWSSQQELPVPSYRISFQKQYKHIPIVEPIDGNSNFTQS